MPAGPDVGVMLTMLVSMTKKARASSLVAVAQRESVQAAEIVGNRHRRIDASVAADLHACR